MCEPVDVSENKDLNSSKQNDQSAKALTEHQKGWSSANKGWDFIKPKAIGLEMEHTGMPGQPYVFQRGKKSAFPVHGFTQ